MAIILTDFRIFRKIITKICDIFFLTKKLVPHYINPNRSLVQLLHLMLTGTVAFSSSPWEEPHPCLARQSMMSLFPRAGWNWRLQRGLQVDLLGGGAPLGLPDHLPAAPPQCPPRNHLDKEPSQQWGRGWEGRELSKCDIWPRMVIILTDFWIFTKKLSIGDIFSHKNWCHLPLNSHESTKISIKNHQNRWQFTHWKCHQNWWKINHQKRWKV